MKILVLNGPNLNLLGVREKSIYGDEPFEEYFEKLKNLYEDHELHYVQSNTEGVLIDTIQEYGFDFDGIVFNAGAYTHTSIALADAIAAVKTPVIEVHISNVFAREDFRKVSMIASQCKGSISGLGLDSYRLALENFLKRN